jgi:hypothetical protein
LSGLHSVLYHKVELFNCCCVRFLRCNFIQFSVFHRSF